MFQTCDHVRSCDKSKALYLHNSTTTLSMVTKLSRVVTYCEGLPLIQLQGPLGMWSCDIISQIKNVISPLSQCLKPANLEVQ